jgi:hypothetical protein
LGQPVFAVSGGLTVAKFGNAALPNGQGTQGNINLNDGVNAKVQGFESQDDNRQIVTGPILFRARSVYLSDDWGPRTIVLPMQYTEDGSHFLGSFLAQLSQAGEQQLTFDNATYILAKYAGITGRVAEKTSSFLTWAFTLNLIAKSPWFQDSGATTATPWNPITVDAGQSANITYAGSVFAEPVFTLHVPNTNAVVINSMQLKNTMSGEFLTVNFLSATAIPASTTRDVVIDCAAMTATCTQTGESYDVSGSFPMLYPPVSTVNPFTVIITPASGSSSGLTLAYSVTPRWQI